MIKSPRLLNSSHFGEKRLHPISVSISEKIVPLSYATMVLRTGESIPNRAFVELFTPNGTAGVFRAKAPEDDYGATDTATIQLEHAICEVGDWLVVDKANRDSTVNVAMSQIFSNYRGSHWQLGTISFTDAILLDVDYDNILEAFLAILEQVPQYYMTFDFSTNPWTIGLAEKSSTVTAEGRLSRNVSTAKVKRDDKDLCTRVYVEGLPKPSGRENDDNAIGYMDADTQSLYGIIERKESQSGLTQAQATRVAQNYLATHKHPKLSVEISGTDLSSVTNEPLDRFALGKRCRLSVPDRGVTVNDVITEINWQDVYNLPGQLTVIVGNNLDAALRFYREQESNAKKSGRATKKALGGIEMTAEYWRAYFDNDLEGLHSELLLTASYWRTSLWDTYSGLSSRIEQTASYWRATLTDEINSLHSEVEQTASYWRATLTDEVNSVRSVVEQTASYWRASIEEVTDSEGRITAASIGIAINKNGSSAKIKADRIYLDASQTITLADKMIVNQSGISITGNIQAGLNGESYIRGTSLKLIGASSSQGVQETTLGYAQTSEMIIKAAVDGNTLKLWKYGDDKTSDPSITFSKAVTLSGAWGSGDDAEKFIVTASSGVTYKFAPPLRLNGTTQASNFSAEITDSSNPPVAKKKIYGYLVSGGSTSGSYIDVNTKNDGTGTSVARISVGALYTSGYNAGNSAGQLTGWSEAYQKVSWAGANTSSASMTIKAPAATKASNPNQQSVTYTLSTDDNVAYIKHGAVVVAQLTHNKWTAGYNSGRGSVSIGSVSRSGATVTAIASNGATGTLSLTSHSNCKANVTGVKISGNWLHDVLYYKDGNTYKNVTSSARYWYYSTTYGDPTTYYD